MCKAKELSQKLLEIHKEIDAEFTNTCEALSQSDLKQEDLLHYIEFNSFNASDGYKLAKMIKDVRSERREIKRDLATMKSLKDTIPAQSLIAKIDKNIARIDENNKNKTYTYKVLKKVL